ncbi:hypothetical protein FQR65_LT20684 [Abscondita terminalis]|nr:hypothetical protein FQR65_LT20684 [Abscondita terminalis]
MAVGRGKRHILKPLAAERDETQALPGPGLEAGGVVAYAASSNPQIAPRLPRQHLPHLCRAARQAPSACASRSLACPGSHRAALGQDRFHAGSLPHAAWPAAGRGRQRHSSTNAPWSPDHPPATRAPTKQVGDPPPSSSPDFAASPAVGRHAAPNQHPPRSPEMARARAVLRRGRQDRTPSIRVAACRSVPAAQRAPGAAVLLQHLAQRMTTPPLAPALQFVLPPGQLGQARLQPPARSMPHAATPAATTNQGADALARVESSREAGPCPPAASPGVAASPAATATRPPGRAALRPNQASRRPPTARVLAVQSISPQATTEGMPVGTRGIDIALGRFTDIHANLSGATPSACRRLQHGNGCGLALGQAVAADQTAHRLLPTQLRQDVARQYSGCLVRLPTRCLASSASNRVSNRHSNGARLGASKLLVIDLRIRGAGHHLVMRQRRKRGNRSSRGPPFDTNATQRGNAIGRDAERGTHAVDRASMVRAALSEQRCHRDRKQHARGKRAHCLRRASMPVVMPGSSRHAT